ncbi:hypothetical protein BDV98DRAFT_571415 [Pterulicium gracile]|uniref:Uncharacterized protein n=1 Tax=Pterulicium gracile TaxID=1884261 RepID=A0A5C3QGQ5_9AGAR|nr:hypothetical protein BDV98DRAFT_571415 [Pterula gracilis]
MRTTLFHPISITNSITGAHALITSVHHRPTGRCIQGPERSWRGGRGDVHITFDLGIRGELSERAQRRVIKVCCLEG